MPRKPSSDREREARARLKEQFDAEVRACGEFFAGLDRRDALLDELDQLDAEQAATVARIAEMSGVDRTAEMVAWSKTKVREAVRASRDATPVADGVDTAAEVA